MDKAYVYILYSNDLDKYYIGFTTDHPEERLRKHLNWHYPQAKTFTRKANDWILIWQLQCSTSQQARKIEKHIKNMKSITYLKNLVLYPEMAQKLLSLY